MDQDSIIKEFMALVEIDSLSYKERPMADYLKIKLEELGFEVYEDNAGEKINGTSGNLIATLKGNSSIPCIMFSAHMDTVEPGIGKKAIVRDGYICSESDTILGSDDLSGIAAIMAGIRSIKSKEIPHGDIQVVFTVAEEVGLLGAVNLDYSKINAKYGFILDVSGEVGTAVIKAPTEYNIKISVHGKSSHAGINPEAGISAIKIASEAIASIKMGRIDYETTANISSMHGEGGSTNVVCDLVELEGEARSHDEAKLTEYLNNMKNSFQIAAEKYGGNFEFKETLLYRSININKESQLYELIESAGNMCNIVLNPIHTGGGSDANIFNEKGISVITLGTGMENIRTKSERIKIDQLVKASEFVESIIKATAANLKNK